MRILSIAATALALTAGVASATSFQIADRNGDNEVSKSEFLSIYGPELNAGSFRIIDENHDGVISAAEYTDAMNGANSVLADES